MNNAIIQKYINNFRKNLSGFLKPNIGIQVDIYNCNSEGSILVIEFKPGGKSFDKNKGTYPKISDALKLIPQSFFAGNMSAFHFSGTNVMMDNNRVIMIKDANIQEWNDDKLRSDIKSLIAPPKAENNKYEAR